MANNIVTIKLKNEHMKGLVDFDDDTWYMALINVAGDAVSDDAKRQWSSFSADIQGAGYEITGTGYTAGGVQLSGTAISATGTPTGNIQYLDANDIVLSNTSLSAAGCVVYKTAGAAGSTDLPAAYITFNGVKVSNNGPFSIGWNTNFGLISVT